MTFNRIGGIVLVIAGVAGYFTVADDLRHVGEFVGVTSILLAGLILIVGSLQRELTNVLPVRWMAIGLLSGVVLGALLDNMLLGVTVGFAVGTGVGIALSKRRRSKIRNASKQLYG